MKENLRFYSKEEATDFKINIANTKDFISLEYKANLLENAEA